MKKYMTPEVELLVLCTKEAIMFSAERGPNETDLDEFMPSALVIDDIQTA